jgi:hypothetical protein
MELFSEFHDTPYTQDKRIVIWFVHILLKCTIYGEYFSVIFRTRIKCIKDKKKTQSIRIMRL